ncbi:Ras family protein [Dictyocaulus viviparus]|uniref:Ras family protein n=1 Tax=Dictyocaulus viviparus TaxID=29172 RepID=A0A0D8Y597_DICVI|nr:Ras family protein [Dictyocaulus viviparus]
MYMRNSSAAIIMYDVTNRQSFEDVDKWIEEIRRCCGITDPLMILVANKCDLSEKRCVSTAEGQAKARHIDARFYEVTLEKPMTFSFVLEELSADLLSGSSSDDTPYTSGSSSVVHLSPRASSVSPTKDSPEKSKCCRFI